MVRWIQRLHMNEKNFDDIGYNFLIGGDGNVYEGMNMLFKWWPKKNLINYYFKTKGRGWKYYGAHVPSYNRLCYGVAYIGDFRKVEPNKKQLEAGFFLFQKGVELGHIKEDYRIYAASQVRVTDSPGTKLIEMIKTWKHWSAKI